MRSQCSVCLRTFGGVSLFDRHRRDGACLDPAALNMRQDGRGVWHGNEPFPARSGRLSGAGQGVREGTAENRDHAPIRGVER